MLHWYRNSYNKIVAKYGEDAHLFIDLLAITSARSDIKTNIKLAVRAYYQLRHDGLRQSSFRYLHFNALQRYCITGRVGGRKCSALAQCLKYQDARVVPVDIWMLRAYGITNRTKPTKAQYDRIEQAVIAEAKQAGMSIRDYQIMRWVKARGKSTSYARYIK